MCGAKYQFEKLERDTGETRGTVLCGCIEISLPNYRRFSSLRIIFILSVARSTTEHIHGNVSSRNAFVLSFIKSVNSCFI